MGPRPKGESKASTLGFILGGVEVETSQEKVPLVLELSEPRAPLGAQFGCPRHPSGATVAMGPGSRLGHGVCPVANLGDHWQYCDEGVMRGRVMSGKRSRGGVWRGTRGGTLDWKGTLGGGDF